jgi:hypothetical protein
VASLPPKDRRSKIAHARGCAEFLVPQSLPKVARYRNPELTETMADTYLTKNCEIAHFELREFRFFRISDFGFQPKGLPFVISTGLSRSPRYNANRSPRSRGNAAVFH